MPAKDAARLNRLHNYVDDTFSKDKEKEKIAKEQAQLPVQKQLEEAVTMMMINPTNTLSRKSILAASFHRLIWH